MRIIVSFSGGKDSLACLIWALKEYGNRITPVFHDTGWEHPLTYQHIKEVEEKIGIPIIHVNSAYTFETIALKKGRSPSAKARFCTEFLKIRPSIDYLLDNSPDHTLMVQGIRGAESPARSQMAKECRIFKYYFEPYTTDKKGRKYYHNYRSAEVKEFCKKYTDDLLRPVFDWSAKDVFDYIKENGFTPNPLYFKNMGRVGCFPCIMVNQRELRNILTHFPEVEDKIRNFEGAVDNVRGGGVSFFPPNYIPKWAMTGEYEKKDGTLTRYATFDDVKKYVMDNPDQLTLFEETPAPACMSVYNICE